MAGFGKNPRGSKRGSSSSSYVSTVTMALVVGFCFYGVYALTTSSSSSSSSPTISSLKHNSNEHSKHKQNSVPRNVLRDNKNVEDDDEDSKVVTGASAGTEEDTHPDSLSAAGNFQNQDLTRKQEEEVETETKHTDQSQENQNQPEETLHNDASNNQSNEEDNGSNSNEQQQEETAEQNNDENQQQEGTEEQHAALEENSSNDNEQLEQHEENQNTENDDGQKESNSDSNESQLETNDGQKESDKDSNDDGQKESNNDSNDGGQKESNSSDSSEGQSEIGDGQAQNEERHIEQVTKSESDEGEISQSQIEHDNDGTIESNEQHQRQQQQQEQKQKHMEEENAAIDEVSSGEESQNDIDQTQKGSGSVSSSDSSEDIEKKESENSAWATQADHSSNEKRRRKEDDFSSSESNEQTEGDSDSLDSLESKSSSTSEHEWKLCNMTAGPDYIPCLDNEKAIKQLRSFRHFEHRERHCPEEAVTCLVPLPKGYKRPIEWPQSRDRIWYNNVPRTKLAEVKGHQNWVKVTGEYLTFPGGGTQFIHGALHYIDFIQKSVPEIAWGKHTRVILDVGCGVASFGGYLFERDVLAMSFAPKDEHEAQVQFALERGIPAFSAVMGSQRLPFPSKVFDVVHCARCRVPWHANDGALLLELNRVLRPGGFFVWSATPVYQKLKEDVEIWEAMSALTKAMCWDLHTIKKDKLNSVGAAMYRKPTTNECYENRKNQKPPTCKEDDDANAAWYVPLQACMHRIPTDKSIRGSLWPEEWPKRLEVPPYWLNDSQTGVYGKPAPEDFTTDYEHWKHIVNKSYLTGFGIEWSKVRNVMDMRAVYGGFAAALKDMKLWVLNLVNIDAPDTLPIIYERGLFGMYHDWCESHSTYPRTYDLLHADRLFSNLKKRCEILPTVVEVDRIVRPGGKLIVRDESEVVSEVENLLKSLHWEIRLTFSKNNEGILCAEKTEWRPEEYALSS